MSHKFEFDAAGNLVHFIHDEPRALVAPENVAAYRESCPEAPLLAAKQPAKATAAQAPRKAAKGRKGGK